MNELLKKLEGTLEKEDLLKLEESIKLMIDEKVEILVEEEKKKLELLSEEFVTKETKERSEKFETELTETYDEKMKSLEESVVDKLDKFIDSEISENISEESIEKIAINEVYKPIVDGITSLFEEKFVALDTEGSGILKEAKVEIEKLEEQVSTTIAEKMELKESTEKLKVDLMISEKTVELTESEKERVSTFFAGKDSVEVSEKIDSFLELINEKEESEDKDSKENLNEDVNDGDNGIDETKDLEKTSDLTETEKYNDRVNNLL